MILDNEVSKEDRIFVKNYEIQDQDVVENASKDITFTQKNQLEQREEPAQMEIPKASEIGLHKDPRLHEFEGVEKFTESLTHVGPLTQTIPSSQEIEDLNNLIAYTNKELTLKYKRVHK
jgi:hypothetical protein